MTLSLCFLEGPRGRQASGLSEATQLASRTWSVLFLGFLVLYPSHFSQRPDGLELELQWGAICPQRSLTLAPHCQGLFPLLAFCVLSKQTRTMASIWTSTWVRQEGTLTTHRATGNSPHPSASEDCLGAVCWPGLEVTRTDTASSVVPPVVTINTPLCTRGCSLEKRCCVFGERVALFNFICSQKRRSWVGGEWKGLSFSPWFYEMRDFLRSG